MRPHSFASDFDHTEMCELCGETADAPIHELDGVLVGDAEDDLPQERPAPCAECGDIVTRRWHQGPDTTAPLVCFECFNPLLTYDPPRA